MRDVGAVRVTGVDLREAILDGLDLIGVRVVTEPPAGVDWIEAASEAVGTG